MTTNTITNKEVNIQGKNNRLSKDSKWLIKKRILTVAKHLIWSDDQLNKKEKVTNVLPFKNIILEVLHKKLYSELKAESCPF